MNHLTLYAYEQDDGTLVIYRCPVCGSTGPKGSGCPHEPSVADGNRDLLIKREPVQVPVPQVIGEAPISAEGGDKEVPGVGEEPRYTAWLKEQVEAAEELRQKAWADDDLIGATIHAEAANSYRAVIRHFTQQPVGAGAGIESAGGHQARKSCAGQASADSDGNQPYTCWNCGESSADARSGGNQQPLGGDADAAGGGSPQTPRPDVAEGGSGQGAGSALAQLRGRALEMRELVGRAAFFDRHPEASSHDWDRLGDAARGTLEGNAMAAVEAVFDALTQHPSGGQEGGVEEGADRRG